MPTALSTRSVPRPPVDVNLDLEPPSESEWEYEYDEDETEDLYFTLDLTNHVPAPFKKPIQRPRNGKGTLRDIDKRSNAEAAAEKNGAQVEPPGRLQVLDLHSKNPLIAYNNAFYSCYWVSDLGTQMYFSEKGVAKNPLRSLRACDLVGTSGARLVAKPATLHRRATASSDDDSGRYDNPIDIDSESTPQPTPQSEPRPYVPIAPAPRTSYDSPAPVAPQTPQSSLAAVTPAREQFQGSPVPSSQQQTPQPGYAGFGLLMPPQTMPETVKKPRRKYRKRRRRNPDTGELTDWTDDEEEPPAVPSRPSNEAQSDFLHRLAAIKRRKGETDEVPMHSIRTHKRPANADEIRDRWLAEEARSGKKVRALPSSEVHHIKAFNESKAKADAVTVATAAAAASTRTELENAQASSTATRDPSASQGPDMPEQSTTSAAQREKSRFEEHLTRSTAELRASLGLGEKPQGPRRGRPRGSIGTGLRRGLERDPDADAEWMPQLDGVDERFQLQTSGGAVEELVCEEDEQEGEHETPRPDESNTRSLPARDEGMGRADEGTVFEDGRGETAARAPAEGVDGVGGRDESESHGV